MRSASENRRGREPDVEALLLEAKRPAPELSAFFYRLIGASWHWTGKLAWTDDEWRAWVERPEHHLLSCWVDGVPAGYVEFEQQTDGSVEIAYFGLVSEFHGVGLGGWLLSQAIDFAWGLAGTKRVWLHTCSLDGPAALANYQARGFEIVEVETDNRSIAAATSANSVAGGE